MALRPLPFQSLTPFFQPIPYTARPLLRIPALQRIRLPPSAAAALAVPLLGLSGISSLLQELWDGLLRAVPKKKTSYSKKRSRQMAGKALKDVTALVKCPSCGRTKRKHVLCAHCVAAIKLWFNRDAKGKGHIMTNKKEENNEKPEDRL